MGPSTLNMRGIDGPVISASRIAVLNPCFAVIDAISPVTRDLPTPPFPDTMPITCLTFDNAFTGTVKSVFSLQLPWLSQELQSCVHSLINSLPVFNIIYQKFDTDFQIVISIVKIAGVIRIRDVAGLSCIFQKLFYLLFFVGREKIFELRDVFVIHSKE